MEYLNVKKAALYNKSGVQAIYRAIDRGGLKYKKIPMARKNTLFPVRSYEIVTTTEWLDDWAAQKKQKEFQKFNGKSMYNHDKGEMNSKQAMASLGITKGAFFHYVYNGRIKFTRKGMYYIFHTEDVEKLRVAIAHIEARKIA